MHDIAEALKAAANIRGLYALTGFALVLICVIIGLILFADIHVIAKYAFSVALLLMFLGMFLYVVHRTPRTPPDAGPRYWEIIAEKGAIYGHDGHIMMIDDLRQTQPISNPDLPSLPSPEEGASS